MIIPGRSAPAAFTADRECRRTIEAMKQSFLSAPQFAVVGASTNPLKFGTKVRQVDLLIVHVAQLSQDSKMVHRPKEARYPCAPREGSFAASC